MRTRIFALILLFFIAVVIAGLAYNQIAMHERYRLMSEENRLKVIPLMAPRGSIYDRDGRALVKDALSFKVSIIYNRIKNKESLKKVLSSALGLPGEEIDKVIEKSRRQPFSPTPVAEDIGIEKAIHIEEAGIDHPGLLLEVSAKREYMRGDAASNLLGYLGFINRSEFDRLKHYGYKINDLIGRDGVEKCYDNYLRGTHGGKQIEVDHRGREVVTLGFKEPVPGKDIQLTLDANLQEFCDELLEGKKGAIIAMNPQTGEILAMSSAPSYDPMIFIDPSRRKEVASLLRDRNYPLVNRAIAGAYAPGSVFKPVIATGALETKAATKVTTFECPGYFTLGRATFRCWRESGHGAQTVTEAIKNSCNVYFFRLGLLLGAERIAEFAEKLGFGRKTGIDLPGERSKEVPSPSWKKKHLSDKWYKGDTVNYSIGQGYLLVSPLQVARMMSVFANGGYLVKPYVVSKVSGVSVASQERLSLGLSRETLSIVREGLERVVNDPYGTGMKARQRKVTVAGKTGTAQTSRGISHGWFAGFAPFKEAKLTVVVFDEYGGKGGYYAAETAGRVFKKAYELGLLD